MSKELATINTEAIEKALIRGDLSGLSPEQKVSYYNKVCDSVGLNPLTKPFEFIRFNGKEILYAGRSCTEQLRQIHSVSLTITSREMVGDVYIVTARARVGNREDESTGAVTVKGLSGDMLANAYMKAETKAKRRVTLSVCGLAFLDETEVETIPGATKVDVDITSNQEEKKPAIKLITSKPASAEPEVKKTVSTKETGLGDFVLSFGNKNVKNKKLKEIDPKALESFISWVRQQPKLDAKGAETLSKAEQYLQGLH